MKRLIDKFFRWLGYIRLDQSVVKIKEVHFNAIDIRHEIMIDRQSFSYMNMGEENYIKSCKPELIYGILEKVKEFIEFDYVKDSAFRNDTYAARIFIAKRERKD